MNKFVEQLAESLFRPESVSGARRPVCGAKLQESYRYFQSLCNGGYTADFFYHFFGSVGPLRHDILEWNDTSLWKEYFSLDAQCFVFAEDIFGTQFLFDIRGNRRVVKMLIPDSGKMSICANTFEDFLEDEIFANEPDSGARRLAARFFDEKRVPFEPFTHISCKTPVLLGGKQQDLDNLELNDSLANLMILGQIVSQVRTFPPGTRIDRFRLDK